MKRLCCLLATTTALLTTSAAFATNPLITDQFTADPTARVFEGRVYVYPSHDIREPAGYTGRPNWFVMEDYHVFSSANLTDWTDHGVILTQKDVPWADPAGFAMWAPDCVFKDGKYYFYFPAKAKDGSRRIGVAIADSPAGPFKPQPNYMQGVFGIDWLHQLRADGYAGDVVMISVLVPARNARSCEAMSASVTESTAVVGSCNTSTGAPAASARASATRCRCPPDSRAPDSPTRVSAPSGKDCSMSAHAAAFIARATISSSAPVAAWSAGNTFSTIVPSKRSAA
jgi:hypothetical protein